MAHLIMLADTYTNFHHCFRVFLDKQGQSDRYSSPWGVKIREIKLYDVIYSERDEQVLLEDIKHFEYEREYGRESNKIVKWLQKLAGKYLRMQPIDMSKVKPTTFTKEEKNIHPYPEWFCYTKVIGKAKDVYRDGMEMI